MDWFVFSIVFVFCLCWICIIFELPVWCINIVGVIIFILSIYGVLHITVQDKILYQMLTLWYAAGAVLGFLLSIYEEE